MPRLGNKLLLKDNLQYWLNDRFLKNGFYSNVAVGDVDLYSNDISRLITVDDENYSTGRVWQSPFKNWVYESGIASDTSGVAPPSVASGVVVNGTFTSTGHYIDFPNGRVIFDVAQSASSVIQASFSYKHVTVELADKINNETEPLLIETSYKDNPSITGIDIYPSNESRTLPAVFIDILGSKSDGYELGAKSLVTTFDGVLHIWARNDYTRDLIEDTLASAARDVIFGVDYNTAPYPLLFRGRRNPSWYNFDSFSNRWSPYLWRRIYIESVDTVKDAPLFEIERTRVRFKAKIYPNF